MARRIRIVLADDHPVVREGLRGMLAGQDDFAVIGEAENGDQAILLAEQLQPDVILMDLRMQGTDGVAAIKGIRARGLATHVLVVTTYDSDADIVRAVEAGAIGYLLKDAPRQELFRAVRAAASGETVLTPAVASRLLGRMRSPAEETLTEREIDVLRLVAGGSSNRQIGRALHISEATVKTHLVHIFTKLDVSDRTAAVIAAMARGILRLD
jgi:DNA-binding NarL/FixJ family response regulator